jgi:hypothetical protein
MTLIEPLAKLRAFVGIFSVGPRCRNRSPVQAEKSLGETVPDDIWPEGQ